MIFEMWSYEPFNVIRIISTRKSVSFFLELLNWEKFLPDSTRIDINQIYIDWIATKWFVVPTKHFSQYVFLSYNHNGMFPYINDKHDPKINFSSSFL